jgi:hypothetical protein
MLASTAYERKVALSPTDLEFYQQHGYLGPFPFLGQTELHTLLNNCWGGLSNQHLFHPLTRHAVVPAMAELGSNPKFLNPIKAILGNNVLLWGGAIIKQKPGRKKHFHLDAEFTLTEGASVWLGVKNVVSEKTFSLIAGSHLVPASPQELANKDGLNLSDEQAVSSAATSYNPNCHIVHLKIEDGQFIIFHGRLWHATSNITDQPRLALNFRYAPPNKALKVTKNGDLPNVTWMDEPPVCILISGEDNFHLNCIIHPKQIGRLSSLMKGWLYYLPKNLIKKAVKLVRRKS